MQSRKKPQQTAKRTPTVSAQVGRFIRAQRIEQKVSVAEVSKYVGVSEEVLKAYESGTKEIPLRHVFALSNCLNITPAAILRIINKLR